MTAFDSIRANNDKSLAKATKTHAALESHLSSSELSNWPLDMVGPEHLFDSGYCADGTLSFKANSEELWKFLDLLKPMDLVFVEGSSVTTKPQAYVRAEEFQRENVMPIAPVLIKTDRTDIAAIWWTRLSTGAVLQVSVTGHAPSSAGSWAGSGRPGSYAYSTGHTSFSFRALKSLSELARLPSLAQWLEKWARFVESDAEASQLRTLFATLRNGALEMHWGALSNGLPLTEKWDEVLNHRGLTSLHLHAWVTQMANELGALAQAHAQEVETVRAAIRELLANGLPTSSATFSRGSSDFRHLLVQHLSEKTGLRLSSVDIRARAHGDAQVTFQFDHGDSVINDCPVYSTRVRHDMVVPRASIGDKVLRPQDLPVTYVD